MTRWRDVPLCGFDTETTGPDPLSDRIVSATVGWPDVGGWNSESWLIRPDVPIPQAATDVHGISDEDAAAHGVPAMIALEQIRDELTTAWQHDGCVVVAYNAAYDFTILDRELRRNGLAPLRVAGPIVDPMLLDVHLDRYRKGSRKLVDVCAHYGITLDGAHDANNDALAATRLAWKLLPYFNEQNANQLAELQAAEYRRRQDYFNGRALGEGRPEDVRPTDWPVWA